MPTHPLPLTLLLAFVAGVAGAWLVGRGSTLGWLLLAGGAGATWYGLRGLAVQSRHREQALADAQAQAGVRDRELDRMRQVADAMVSVDTLGHVLQVIADAVADLLQSESSAIGFVVEEGRFVRVVAASGWFQRARDRLIPVDHSLLGTVVTTEQPLVSDNMAADPRNFAFEDDQSTTLACVPLTASGFVVGVLAACNRRDGRPFTPGDIRLLQTLGDLVVVGLDRAHVLEESRRKEEVLAAKNRELMRSTELKSQFLANMSHELRTPLNAINGFSDLLLTEEPGELNDSQREFLDSILRNGRHLLDLINSVLDLSKIEAGRMTLSLAQNDLREAILGAVTDTAPLRTGKQQECVLEIGSDPLPVLADGGRVRQILFNLLSNASKFTPERGTVTVSAIATRAPLPIPSDRSGESQRFVSRECVWISVRDTGIGIRQEDLDKLFQEFSQVDSSASRMQQGTGLGLALSKRFVETHGGTIGCESVYGHGATFWFILPAEGPLRKSPGSTEVARPSTSRNVQPA